MKLSSYPYLAVLACLACAASAHATLINVISSNRTLDVSGGNTGGSYAYSLVNTALGQWNQSLLGSVFGASSNVYQNSLVGDGVLTINGGITLSTVSINGNSSGASVAYGKVTSTTTFSVAQATTFAMTGVRDLNIHGSVVYSLSSSIGTSTGVWPFPAGNVGPLDTMIPIGGILQPGITYTLDANLQASMVGTSAFSGGGDLHVQPGFPRGARRREPGAAAGLCISIPDIVAQGSSRLA